MKNKVLIILGGGVYPHVTGGMEVFNYYLIRELKKHLDIRYLANTPLDFNGCIFHPIRNLKPSKILFPLQLFWHFLTHPEEKTILISFSSAHWFIWWMYAIMTDFFKLNAITVIHYGKTVPSEHPFVYKKFFRSQKAVIAVSNDIKRNYDCAFGTDCIVLPPMVPFEQSKLNIEECRNNYSIPLDATVICMIGSIKSMKNPDTVIEAVASMTKEETAIVNPFIIFAGGGDLINALNEKAIRLGISERVKFLGVVPKNDVKYVMKASDIYLIASDFEGTSVSLLEAMFNKKAIITSRAPGIIDMVREGIDCIMFETKNSELLKNAIITLSKDQLFAEKISQSANNRYNEVYSYKNMLDTYIKLLS